MRIRFPKRSATRSYLISGVLHIGLLGLAFCLSLPEWAAITPSAEAVETATSNRPATHREVPAAHMDGLAEQREEENSPPSANNHTLDAPPSEDDPGLAQFAQRRIEHVRRQAEASTPAEQRADLEDLGQRLNAVASEASVAELSGTLSNWLGATERASEPTPHPRGESVPFDSSTAQISDVKQIRTDQGLSYVAILVDAAGTALETELDAADGAQLYETFQLIKRFPLMETIYRRTVMGLLDKLAREAPPAVLASPPATEPDSDTE